MRKNLAILALMAAFAGPFLWPLGAISQPPPPPSGPVIRVIDAVDPMNDLQFDFGPSVTGTIVETTVTVMNAGVNTSLALGAVGSKEPPATPFEITFDDCSGRVLVPGENCVLRARFSAGAVGIYTTAFDIPSNDPAWPVVRMSLAGESVLVPPPTPALPVNPPDGVTGLSTDITFEWLPPVTSAGNLSYSLHLDTDPAFSNPLSFPVVAGGSALAALGGTGLLLFGPVGFRRREIREAMALAAILAGILMISSCGGGGSSAPARLTGTPPVTPIVFTVTGLPPGTTYYWKIIADDGQGGTSESAARSFTVR